MVDNYLTLYISIVWYKRINPEFATMLLQEEYSSLFHRQRKTKLTAIEKREIITELKNTKGKYKWVEMENKYKKSRYDILNELKIKDY